MPISGDITGLHWLNPTQTPLDALLKGAQVGNIIADNMARRQQLGMEAARLPFEIKALDTRNKIGEAALAEQWMQNEQIATERAAWQQDLVTTEPFMTETDPDRLSAMPVPAARTAKMQTAVHNRALQASQHLTVKARTGQYTELNKQAAEVFDGGETLTPVKDAFGVTTYDQNEIAAKKAIIAEREQAKKLELQNTKDDASYERSLLRSNTGLDIQAMRSASDIARVLASPGRGFNEGARLRLASMHNEFKMLEERAKSMKAGPDTERTLASERATIQNRYARMILDDSGTPQSPSRAAEINGGVPSPATPEDARKLPPGTKFMTPDGRLLTR